MADSNTVSIHINKPYLSVAEYAEKYGLKKETVRKRVQRGLLPVRPRRKKGEHIQINEALLIKQALSAKY